MYIIEIWRKIKLDSQNSFHINNHDLFVTVLYSFQRVLHWLTLLMLQKFRYIGEGDYYPYVANGLKMLSGFLPSSQISSSSLVACVWVLGPEAGSMDSLSHQVRPLTDVSHLEATLGYSPAPWPME